MEEHSDQYYIERSLSGDTDAFSHLVSRYLSSVYGFISYRLGSTHMSSDITQEVFLKAWKHLHTFKTDKNFKTWLLAIARNSAIDYSRKKREFVFSDIDSSEDDSFEESIVDEALGVDELFEQKETMDVLQAALKTVSSESRSILLLHSIDGLTFDEISRIVGAPIDTVKSRYRRALLRLRSVLRESAPKS